jgi:hypothetical protein
LTNESASIPPDVESVFASLEKQEENSGQMYRRFHRSPTLDVVAYVNQNERMRGVRFEFRDQSGRIGEIERVRGLSTVLQLTDTSEEHLALEQTRPGDDQLFAVVVNDLMTSSGVTVAAENFMVANRLSRWRNFFARSRDGLTTEQQLGLFAELVALSGPVQEALGLAGAVRSWHGPLLEVHDFSTENWALEIKSSAGSTGQARISSENQLERFGIHQLFLMFTSFDVRSNNQGRTLSQEISALRKALTDIPEAADLFEDRLLDVGYLDLHAHLYVSHYLPVRNECFEIDQDFPSIRRSELPEAISKVTYSLNIDLCQKWRVSKENLALILEATG